MVYRQERDIDFFNVCEKIRKEHSPEYISIENIVREAITRPAQSYYLSIKEYCRIINGKAAGVSSKIDLYTAVRLACRDIKKKHPGKNTTDIACMISEMPAPRFYLSETRGARIYYNMLKSNRK